jgi:uncharacterized protein
MESETQPQTFNFARCQTSGQMDVAPHDLAIRVLGNQLSLEKSQTRSGKTFKLLNVPYFAVSQLDKYIEWAMATEIKEY